MSDIYIQVKKGGGGGLPVTGQTTSYRTGDDGNIQAGIPNAGRFIDNGDGTITDTATNLMWRKWSMGMNQSNGIGTAGTYNWNTAIDFIGDTHAGHSDWRLPNILELLTLFRFDAAGSQPWTYQSVFPSTVANQYWSATSYANDTNASMRVFFGNGFNIVSSGSKNNSSYVRLVRQI